MTSMGIRFRITSPLRGLKPHSFAICSNSCYFRITSPLRGLKLNTRCYHRTYDALELLPHWGDWNPFIHDAPFGVLSLELLPHCGDWNLGIWCLYFFILSLELLPHWGDWNSFPVCFSLISGNFRITSPLRGLKLHYVYFIHDYLPVALELLPHWGDWNLSIVRINELSFALL